MSDHERDYYARKFREELDRIDKNDAIVRAKTAESFMAVLHDVVNRVAPHLWDRMRDVWMVIFQRWMHSTD